MTSFIHLYVVGLFLVLLQALAALPWLLLVFDSRQLRFFQWFTPRFLVAVLIAALGPALLMSMVRDHDSQQFYGGIYGAILHLQLSADFFVLGLGLLLLVWPKGAAVALAAFREGWRQPMFWLILALTFLLLIINPYIPYFTFGEDHKMFKELGYDMLMLSAGLFGVLAASMSISEEIEGRTAVTLMSKPVSRRQFLIGKFVGILFACLLMTGFLSWVFDAMMLYKLHYEIFDIDKIPMPAYLDAWTPRWQERWGEVPAYFFRGAVFWMDHVVGLAPGVVLGFCQVMVLLAVAVALATRLPMIVNLVVCLVIFFLGHLTPVLEQVSRDKTLIQFIAQLFDTLLPGLDLFHLGPVIARDEPPAAGPFSIYVGMVSLYALLYTTIALLFGLLLFEDRDLA